MDAPRHNLSSRALALWLAAAAGCAPVMSTPTPDDPAEGPSGPVSLVVDGRPVRCDDAVETGSEAEIEILGGGAGLTAELDGVALEIPEADALGIRALVVQPPVGRASLRVVGDGDACAVSLSSRPTANAYLAALEAASQATVRTTRSSETGAVESAVVDVPTEGADAQERADGFVARFAGAFAVAPEQLRFLRSFEQRDGWWGVDYEQVIDGVPALGGGLTVRLDEAGRVRLVHSHAFADVGPGELRPHGLDVALAMQAAEPLTSGVVAGARRVWIDRRAPRGGWVVAAADEDLVLDDASRTVVRTRAHTLSATQVQVGYSWHDLPAIVGPSIALVGPAGASGPATTSETEPSATDRELWQLVSRVAAYSEDRFGVVGFGPGTPPPPSGPTPGPYQPPAVGAVRALTQQTPLYNAFYNHEYDTMLFGTDFRTTGIVCHEVAHGIHNHASAFSEAIGLTFFEALADLFAIDCIEHLSPNDDPYLLVSDEHEPERDLATPTHRRGEALVDFDDVLANGGGNPYEESFLLSHAVVKMREVYGLAPDRVAEMVFEAMGWREMGTYPRMRDRWLATAQAWVDADHQGWTQADVCAVARGFRDTRLDGEYGVGGLCGAPARGTELVCTTTYCPVCDEAGAGAEGTPVCAPETLTADAPTCRTAFGRPTCLGSLSLTDEGCPSGEIQHCWCVADGEGGARWDCPPRARCGTRPAQEAFWCPERGPCREGDAPRACGSQLGVCSGAVQTCEEGWWSECSIAPTAELTDVCDGADRDCDGELDEGALRVCYADADQDGFAALGAAGFTSCGPCPADMTQTPPTPRDHDCCDIDPRVHTYASAHDTPSACGGFDFDCDGESRPIEGPAAFDPAGCATVEDELDCALEGHGWAGRPPECGREATRGACRWSSEGCAARLEPPALVECR